MPYLCGLGRFANAYLEVKRGEFVSIMGRSGCGKTTLLNCLGMMHRQDSGTILYKGVRTNNFYGDDLAEIRRKEIAYVFQDFYLMDSLSILENIMLPLILNEDDPGESRQRARELAEKFEIIHLLEKKPVNCRAVKSRGQLYAGQ